MINGHYYWLRNQDEPNVPNELVLNWITYVDDGYWHDIKYRIGDDEPWKTDTDVTHIGNEDYSYLIVKEWSSYEEMMEEMFTEFM